MIQKVKSHKRVKKNSVSVVKTHTRTKVAGTAKPAAVPKPKMAKITPTNKPMLNNAKMVSDGTACHVKKHPKLADHYHAHVGGKKTTVHKSAVKFNFQK